LGGSFLQSHSGSVFERAEALIPALYDWRVIRTEPRELAATSRLCG
jgi:hypothetical protein